MFGLKLNKYEWFFTHLKLCVAIVMHNFKSIDVRFWKSKIFLWPYNIGIQMKLKELTKTFMMISSW